MNERGFTLVELLVTILIIGILAAIALPTFIGQRAKASDATVKVDLRNAVTQMETCFTEQDSYSGCPDADHQLAGGVAVIVTGGGARYEVSEQSGTGTSFTIRRLASGYERGCTDPGAGGCGAGGHW